MTTNNLSWEGGWRIKKILPASLQSYAIYIYISLFFNKNFLITINTILHLSKENKTTYNFIPRGGVENIFLTRRRKLKSIFIRIHLTPDRSLPVQVKNQSYQYLISMIEALINLTYSYTVRPDRSRKWMGLASCYIKNWVNILVHEVKCIT